LVTHLDPLKPKMPEAVKNRILVPADTRTWRPSTTEPARLDGWRGRRRTSHPHAGREPAFGFRRPGFLTLSRGPRGRDSATTRARPPPPGPRAPHLRRPRPRRGHGLAPRTSRPAPGAKKRGASLSPAAEPLAPETSVPLPRSVTSTLSTHPAVLLRPASLHFASGPNHNPRPRTSGRRHRPVPARALFKCCRPCVTPLGPAPRLGVQPLALSPGRATCSWPIVAVVRLTSRPRQAVARWHHLPGPRFAKMRGTLQIAAGTLR
jgi:hypothetical protein